MNADEDFTLDAHEPTATDAAADSPPPKVVIEYRDRGFHSLLLPPVLILLSVLVILSSRRGTPIFAPAPAPVVSQPETAPPPVVAALVAEKAAATVGLIPSPSSPPATAAPSSSRAAELKSALPALPDLDEMMPAPSLVARNAPAPASDVPAPSAAPPAGSPPADVHDSGPASGAPAPAPVDEAQAATSPQPETPSPASAGVNKIQTPLLRDEPAPAPPPVEAQAAAEPPPEPTREQVLDEIREEAARKAAEIRKLEDLRPHVRELELRRVLKKTEAGRAAFHRALRELVKNPRPEIGRDLEALCNEYGRSTLPEIRAKISKLLRTTYARSSLKNKVEMMRVWGLPEPMVFDYVANESYRHLGTRGGPRDGDQVGLRAARLLLSMPPASTSGRAVAGSSPPARTVPGTGAN